MVSYIKSFFNYLFSYNSEEQYDKEMEEYLAEELFKLDSERDKEEENTNEEVIVNKADCYERTGIVTHISDEDDYVLIDGMLYCSITACSIKLNINDKVVYLCYKDSNESIIVVRILTNVGEHWGDFEPDVDESGYKVIEHVIIGEVEFRDKRMVIMKNSDLKINLDNVTATFIPVKGDFLQMKCMVQFDEDHPMDMSSNRVLEVISFQPLRSKVLSVVVTQWNGENGVCNREFFVQKSTCIFSHDPQVGVKANIEAVESNQGKYNWRVIKMDITELPMNPPNVVAPIDDMEQISLENEKQHNVEVTFPLKFENVRFNEQPQITLNITNKGYQQVIVYKWMILCKKRDSQVNVSPFLNAPKRLNPNETFSLTIKCCPKFYGLSKEHMIITFRGFKVERYIEVNVLSESISLEPNSDVNLSYNKSGRERREIMNCLRGNDQTVIPGVKRIRNPNFVSVKIGQYSIPEKIWNLLLSNTDNDNDNQNQIFDKIETAFPCLLQSLNIGNYIDQWHTLLYLEEVEATIKIKAYNIANTFLTRCQEYLGVEVKGLAEKRPSIILGDKVVVTDLLDDALPSYEGYVHAIQGEVLLIKFHPQFHSKYQGSDVAVEFYLNRSNFRKCHHAVNLAISKLGPEILFPSRVIRRAPQIPVDKLSKIKWFKEDLNSNQKAAVYNILLGECRPMPYVIYGPPGTGKTVTIIETLLQILTYLPDSRILVATPSNSAANLITERLLQYRKQFSNSIIRLIANYMIDSENIPDAIKPYCATLHIAVENTAPSSHMVQNGINLNVPASYVARYQVAIGTCQSLGTLAQMELPKGHFTHIIIDEAGQLTEPDIMLPMTFINKESGQIVISGDPMQLGPVVFSPYCTEFGLKHSFLSRVLETFQYQKDFASFENGFNEKLVTLLTFNYRSLQEILTISNEIFYDSTLVAMIDRNTPFIQKIVNVVSEIYELNDEEKCGGIFVHGVKGTNLKAVDSPSWYNPQEASMIALTVCKFYRKNVTPDEIGIITPYKAQIKHIRRLFQHMNLLLPKVGTVEEFQGQEKPLILLSTVRSTESELVTDQKYALGFVSQPKRFNVALTRGQAAVLLFCDPHLLATDTLWSKVLIQAIKENKYMGCEFALANNMIKSESTCDV